MNNFMVTHLKPWNIICELLMIIQTQFFLNPSGTTLEKLKIMKKYRFKINLLCLCLVSISFSQKILIPMDQTQNDHLKSYGIAYYALKRNINVEWLLNFQGGSFLIDSQSSIKAECKIRGVTFIEINNEVLDVYWEACKSLF